MSLISNHDDKFKTVIRKKNNNGNKKKGKLNNNTIFLCKCCEIKRKFNSNKPLSDNLKLQFKIKDILIKIFQIRILLVFQTTL